MRDASKRHASFQYSSGPTVVVVVVDVEVVDVVVDVVVVDVVVVDVVVDVVVVVVVGVASGWHSPCTTTAAPEAVITR